MQAHVHVRVQLRACMCAYVGGWVGVRVCGPAFFSRF